MISPRGLTKVFDGYDAVKGIDFEVAPGEVFGFLGPNGGGQELDDADDRLRVAGDRRRAPGARPRPGGRRARASAAGSAWCPRRTTSTSS